MADSLSMASMAFGARRGAKIAGRALRGLRGAGARAPRHHKKSSKRRGAPHRGGSRGIRLSNDFVKAVLLMSIAKGMVHS
jgi:hypothetical protein